MARSGATTLSGRRRPQRATPDGARAQGVEKQPATEIRVLQDNADKFNKDLTDRRVKAVGGRGRLPSADEAARSFNFLCGDVQQRGPWTPCTEGRKTLLKLALPAPQGSGNAAGRLTRRGRPAVRQLTFGPPEPSFENDFLGTLRPPCVQGTLVGPVLAQKKNFDHT